MTSQHRMPSNVALGCGKRFFRKSGSTSSLASRTWRSRSAKMSSTKILQPSCSPKKLTLLPTTGPRSSNTGVSCDVSVVRNFRSAFVPKTGSSTTAGAGTSGSVLRGERRSKRPTAVRESGFGFGEVKSSRIRALARLRILNPESQIPKRSRPSRLRLLLVLLLRLRLLRALRLRLGRSLRLRLTLHVDAAAEMRALGDRHARRDDVAIHRSVVADVDLLARGDVARHLAQHDDRLGKDLSLDPAVGTDRQHVIAKLNRTFDMTLNGQIFAAVQLAFDDDGLPNIHDVLLHMMTSLGARPRNPGRHRRGRLRRSRWLSARRSDSFIAFPHVILRLVRSPGRLVSPPDRRRSRHYDWAGVSMWPETRSRTLVE